MTFKKKAAVALSALFLFLLGFMHFMESSILQYKDDLIYYSICHLRLVSWSMFYALLIGIPTGIILSRPRFSVFAEKTIQLFNIGSSIPTMAVLALALVVLGIGDGPAIFALILASLLPIVRNTFEGLRQVPPVLLEAARGLGMTPMQSLVRVELPNSFAIMLGGVRTALAINVGTAPLSFIIGGDSLGGLIFPAIYLNNQGQLILGATVTALMALVLDGFVASLGHFILKRRGLA